MANTIKTLTAGDITKKALARLHNKSIVKYFNKEYDDRFAKSGAKNGGTLQIREPNQFTVRSGWTMDTQDVTESTQALTVGTVRGIDINFTSEELTLSMDDFTQRIIDPAMDRLASEIDATILTGLYKGVYNHVHGSGVASTYTTSTLSDVNAARAKLSKGLAPVSDRVVLHESLSMNQIISDSKALFQPASEVARQYSEGLIGTAAGFTFHESELIPTHTQGTAEDTHVPTVDTAGITSGTALIPVLSATGSGTWTEGQVFTIAGIKAVNPETKVAYAHLQQFVITAATTCVTSAVTLAVSPTPITSGAKQNCVISTASTSAVLLTETAGGSGTISTAYAQGLAFHRDAITFVTADIEMPKGVDFASRQVYDGISMSLVRDFNIINRTFPCRIDVLFGYKVVRPEWACRLG